MAAALEHLAADVSRKGFDRLLTKARILSQLRDERVAHVMQLSHMPIALQAIRHALPLLLSAPPVALAVTPVAKCNQVVHHISTELAPAFYVMDLEACHRTGGRL